MVALIIALLERPEHVAAVRTCLEREGHELEAVNSFPKAIRALSSRTFDLIISDVHLENGGSVYDFLKWVKSQMHLQAIPFILFSLEPSDRAKYLADGVRTTARMLGADKYITMDLFDADLLSQEIGELLPRESPAHMITKEGK